MVDWVDLLVLENRHKQAKIDALEHQLSTLRAQCRQVKRSVEMMANYPLVSAQREQSRSRSRQAGRRR